MSPDSQAGLIEAIAGMKEIQAVEAARRLLEEGTDPLEVLEACRMAMEEVGRRYEAGTYFLPELVLAGEMLRQISELAKPLLTDRAAGPGRGKVLIGTVSGDIHDLGKNIVTFMLETNGFTVMDLGVDVAQERFVAAINEFEPRVVGLSGLLILAYESMKKTVEAIDEAGLRDRVKIMVGGGQMNEEARLYIGADAWGGDAVEAVSLAKGWIDRSAGRA